MNSWLHLLLNAGIIPTETKDITPEKNDFPKVKVNLSARHKLRLMTALDGTIKINALCFTAVHSCATVSRDNI